MKTRCLPDQTFRLQLCLSCLVQLTVVSYCHPVMSETKRLTTKLIQFYFLIIGFFRWFRWSPVCLKLRQNALRPSKSQTDRIRLIRDLWVGSFWCDSRVSLILSVLCLTSDRWIKAVMDQVSDVSGLFSAHVREPVSKHAPCFYCPVRCRYVSLLPSVETDAAIAWTLVGHGSLLSWQGLSVTTSFFLPLYLSISLSSISWHTLLEVLPKSLGDRKRDRKRGGGAIEKEKREGWGLERTWNEPINPHCLLSHMKCLSLAGA